MDDPLRAGDLIFVRGHMYSLVDDVIKLGEWLKHKDRPLWGMYSHVAISLGGTTLAEAQGGRVSGYALLDQYAGNYDIGRIDFTDNQREAIAKAAVAQYGEKYDWFLIDEIAVDVLTGIELPYHERCRRICSTYTRSVIKSATGLLIPESPHCSPEDQALDEHVHILRPQ